MPSYKFNIKEACIKYHHVKRKLLTIIACRVINLISKNVTNFLLNQLNNVVHSYSYDLRNCAMELNTRV